MERTLQSGEPSIRVRWCEHGEASAATAEEALDLIDSLALERVHGLPLLIAIEVGNGGLAVGLGNPERIPLTYSDETGVSFTSVGRAATNAEVSLSFITFLGGSYSELHPANGVPWDDAKAAIIEFVESSGARPTPITWRAD